MNTEMPSRSLTIYLIKHGLNPNNLVKPGPGIKKYTIPIGGGLNGRLIIKQPDPKPPRWASFFKDHLAPTDFGEASSCSAVLLAPVASTWAAVTFGQGRHLLASDCCEDRFGLKVALNSIEENRIRTIDKQTFDAIARHTREQANRDVSAQEFGFDVEQDLLRAVVGTPTDQKLGKRLAGMDGLNAHVEIELEGLNILLEQYHKKFLDKSYQKTFPWVDQIAEVSAKTLRDELDELVIKMIRTGRFDRCWLAVPEILDWSMVYGFQYSQAPRSPILNDIHLTTFLAQLRGDASEITKDRLTHRKVLCLGDKDEVITSWPVFKCLYCELDHGGNSFVLSAGRWYKLEKDFVKRVNQSFGRIQRHTGPFLEYDDESEGAYNARAATAASSPYALMDVKIIQGGRKIEFCDLFSKNKEIIHVKRYGPSSVLSHLFHQGLVSGELFQIDQEFRKLVTDKLPKSHRIFDINARPGTREYEVVFGIISQSDKELTLPFFSRVAARHAVSRLEGFGYQVSLAKIGVSDRRKKLKRYRTPRSGKKL